MRWTPFMLLTFALTFAGCDRLRGEKGEPVSGVDQEVAERVLDHVLDRIDAAHGGIGPVAAFDLPEYKRLAAKAEGFENWAEFTKRLRASVPPLDIEYSRRITRRLATLLDEPEEASDEDG